MAVVNMTAMAYGQGLARVETLPEQESIERGLNKLMRTFTVQMDALKRYRIGGEQKVTVTHVSIGEGGQAIVGNVTQAAPKTAPEISEDKTPALTDARQPAMPIIDGPMREPVAARRRRKDEKA
jgi:hypothetical protein